MEKEKIKIYFILRISFFLSNMLFQLNKLGNVRYLNVTGLNVTAEARGLFTKCV